MVESVEPLFNLELDRMLVSRHCFVIAGTLFALFAQRAVLLADDHLNRLRQDQPEDTRFVKTESGFMVPYVQVIPKTGERIEMLPIPGATIRVRAADGNKLNAKANNQAITIEPFWMSKTEITMEQYMPYRQLYLRHREASHEPGFKELEFGDVDGVSAPTTLYDPDYHFEYAESMDSAMPTTSQFAARQYTKWLSLVSERDYRLPHRNEWRHACHSGNRDESGELTNYGFGNDANRLGQYGNFYAGGSKEVTTAVGLKLPNAWGLQDMHGNLSEWVIDKVPNNLLPYGHIAMGGNFDSDAVDCQCGSMVRSTEDWWDEDPDFPRSPWWTTSDEGRATGFRILSPLRSMTSEERLRFWEADSESLRVDVRMRYEEGRGSFGPVDP